MTRLVRTGELKKIMRKIENGKRDLGLNAVSFVYVKSHIGIKGNKEADKKPKVETKEVEARHLVIMEGRLREE